MPVDAAVSLLPTAATCDSQAKCLKMELEWHDTFVQACVLWSASALCPKPAGSAFLYSCLVDNDSTIRRYDNGVITNYSSGCRTDSLAGSTCGLGLTNGWGAGTRFCQLQDFTRQASSTTVSFTFHVRDANWLGCGSYDGQLPVTATSVSTSDGLSQAPTSSTASCGGSNIAGTCGLLDLGECKWVLQVTVPPQPSPETPLPPAFLPSPTTATTPLPPTSTPLGPAAVASPTLPPSPPLSPPPSAGLPSLADMFRAVYAPAPAFNVNNATATAKSILDPTQPQRLATACMLYLMDVAKILEGDLSAVNYATDPRCLNLKSSLQAMVADNEAGLLYFTGINVYAILSSSEFQARVLLGSDAAASIRSTLGEPAPEPESASGAPSAKDWTPKMPDVLDQGECRSCWVLSAWTVLQTWVHIALEGSALPGTPNNAGRANNKVSLQQLGQCVASSTGSINSQCSGGNPKSVSQYSMRQNLLLDGDYTSLLSSKSGSASAACADDALRISTDTPRSTAFGGDLGRVASDKDSIIQALQSGPIMVPIFMNDDLRRYKGGIYDGSSAPGSGTPACNGNEDPNHVLVVVGYDLTGSTPYWIVRNSFGTLWGELGMGRIKMTDGSGVCNMYVSPLRAPTSIVKLPFTSDSLSSNTVCKQLKCDEQVKCALAIAQRDAVTYNTPVGGYPNCESFRTALGYRYFDKTFPDVMTASVTKGTCFEDYFGAPHPCAANNCYKSCSTCNTLDQCGGCPLSGCIPVGR